MKSFLLQDWITVRGAAGTTVTQPENAILDLSAFQDVVLWLDAKEVSGNASLYYQTSPTKDDVLFTPISSGAILPSPGTVNVLPVLKNALPQNGTPICRWLRWQLTSFFAWDLTFRIWVSANQIGASRPATSTSTAAPVSSAGVVLGAPLQPTSTQPPPTTNQPGSTTTTATGKGTSGTTQGGQTNFAGGKTS